MWLWFKRRATSDMYLGTYRDLPTMPSDGISSRFQQVLQHLETGTFQVDCQVYGRANYFNKQLTSFGRHEDQRILPSGICGRFGAEVEIEVRYCTGTI